MKKQSKLGWAIAIPIIAITGFVTLFVIDNITTVLEQAAVMSLKPVKSGVDKKWIHQDVAFGDKDFEKVDIYAQGGAVARPIFVFLHGGFWQGGSKKNYAHIAGMVHRANFVAVIPELPALPGRIMRYFLSDEKLKQSMYPAHLFALQKLMDWLPANIKNYGGDSEQITIAGVASGGQIATMLVFKSKSFSWADKIRRILLFSPVLDLEKCDADFLAANVYPAFGSEPAALFAGSPVNNIIPTKAEFLIMSPKADFPCLPEQARNFTEKMQNAKNKIEWQILTGDTHPSLIFEIGRTTHQSTQDALKFLTRVTSKK